MKDATAEVPARTTVAVLAEDLIWASRLREAIERAGGHAVAVKRADAVQRGLMVIDLTARSYDGIAEVHAAASAGTTVLAVAQHDDTDLRKQALAAGAVRVLSYNKLFNDGPQVMARLMDGSL